MPEHTDYCCKLSYMPQLQDYYHGLIDRTEAERRLRAKQMTNCYLLRLSQVIADSLPAGTNCSTTTTTANNTASCHRRFHVIYVLSFLASTSVCYHFKLIPRLNCFQLGGRLFDCLGGCLSRYYVKDILPGERLRHSVSPCSPPVEYHNQVLCAIRAFEPDDAHDRLGCVPGDRFLLVDSFPDHDCLLVTSLVSRRSGYLPRCCLKKEYPDFIECLEFFHPDTSATQSRRLLENAGAYTYLLRPCDSLPGLFTLLLYDGVKFRKHRLELVHYYHCQLSSSSGNSSPRQSEARGDGGGDTVFFPPLGSSVAPTPAVVDPFRRSSEPSCSSSNNAATATSSSLPTTGSRSLTGLDQTTTNTTDADRPLSNSGLTSTSATRTGVSCGGRLFPSVEAVVAALEAFPPWSCLTAGGGASTALPTSDEELAFPCDKLPMGVHRQSPVTTNSNGLDSLPRVFKPIPRDKPPLQSPSSPIYMRINFRKQQNAPLVPHSSVEIHGELVLLSSSRKKWKSFYAKLDRNQRILCLYDAEKRKSERFDLAKCDYYPLHDTVYDRPCCIGLLPTGASPSDRDDVVLSVDHPSGLAASPSFSGDVEVSTYAGRPCGRLEGSSGEQQQQPPPGLDVIHARWVSALRRHCRNTHVDVANDEDISRRQTQLRCYRALDIKITNAKTVPATQLKSRRDDLPLYFVRLDGIEVARVFSGNSTVNVTFEDFPRGFARLEILAREENKRKRSVAVDLELMHQQHHHHHHQQHASQPKREAAVRHSSADELGTSAVEMPRSAICEVRERCSANLTIAYRELRVLPFQYYESFRQALLSCIDSGLVSLCSYVWKSLSQDSSKVNFVSSLLLVTTELKCHLRLILNLLKMDVNTEKPTASYRGNTLAAQLLDVYNNLVFSDWRKQCFQRVRDEALQTATPLVDTCGGLDYGVRLEPGGGPLVPSLASLHLSGGVTSSSGSKDGGETHTHLVSIAVEDLIKHVDSFPLQLRWIYSQLQAVHSDQCKNVVLCNLIFLRGLLPSLTHPAPTGAPQGTTRASSTTTTSSCPSSGWASCSPDNSSTAAGATTASVESFCTASSTEAVGGGTSSLAKSALVLVSKTLLALVSPIVNAKVSTEHYVSWRSRLMQEFRDRITADLTSDEERQLDSLQESEACEASRKPLSREVAQLANFFLEVLHTKPTPWDSPSAPALGEMDSSQAIFSALRDLNWATHQLLTGATGTCVQ